MFTLPSQTITPRPGYLEDEDEEEWIAQLIAAAERHETPSGTPPLPQQRVLPPEAAAAAAAYQPDPTKMSGERIGRIDPRTPEEQLPEDNLGRSTPYRFDPLAELVRPMEQPTTQPAQPAPQTPSAKPTYQDVAGRIEQPDPDGQRPNVLGHEDEVGFKREEAIARMQELQAQRGEAPQQQPSRRWEDELVAKRGGDYNMDRAWVAGLFGGGPQFAMQLRQQLQGEQNQYQHDLAGARERDLAETNANRPASRALQQGIAGSGMAGPESLLDLREGDPFVKAYTNGGYSQGLRAEGQQLGLQKKILDIESRMAEGEANRGSREAIAAGRNDATVAAAHARKGAGAAAPRNINDLLASQVQEVGAVDFATAQQVVATGDVSAIPPERQSNVQRTLVEFKHLLENDTGKANQVITARQKQTGTADDVLAAHVAKMQADPKYAVKAQGDLTDAARSLKNATSAWVSLNDADKKLFVQLAPLGLAAVAKSAEMTPEGKARSGAILQVMNELIKERSGAAVTDTEWGRIAAELGLSSGSWDPFNSTKGVEMYLDRARERVLKRREDYTRIMGWWK